MAKYKRTSIGSICKGKDGKPDYLKVYGNHVLKDGQFFNLESKATQLAGLNSPAAVEKIQPDVRAKLIERVNNIPDYVRFEVVSLTKE